MPEPVVAGYFGEWSIYERDYHVPDIPAHLVTHIFYAHLQPVYDPGSGTARLEFFDRYAALEAPYDYEDPTLPFRGSLNQLAVLKHAYPHLRTLVSVGGATLSDDFSAIAASAAARQSFAQSCLDTLRAYGFDGVDLDWEYPVQGGEAGLPHRPDDAANYVLLLREIRQRFDAQTALDGRPYLLTVATSALLESLETRFDLAAMSPQVDWFNVMAYNLWGPWSPVTGHHAPWLNSPQFPGPERSVRAAMDRYLALGVPPAKIVLGLPFFGLGYREVPDVNQGLFQPHGGATLTGTWSPGRFEFHDLRDGTRGHAAINTNGFIAHWDPAAQAAYLHHPLDRIFISYESPESVQAKTDGIRALGLRGAMFWSFDSDSADHALQAVLHEQLIRDVARPQSDRSHIVGEVNYDALPGLWDYCYAYAGYGSTNYEVVIPESQLPSSCDPAAPVGVNGSQALWARGDFRAVPALGSTVNPGRRVVDWHYAGLGLGSGLQGFASTRLASENLADYTFSFAAAVTGGLLPGQPTATVTCKVELQLPDDTLAPPDADTNADTVVACVRDFTVPAGGAPAAFQFRLDQGVVDPNAESLFRQYRTRIHQVNVNFNFGRVPTEFGLDTDNSVAVDDLVLRYVPPPITAPPLSIRRNGATLLLEWTGTAELQVAPDLASDFVTLAGASSPHPVSPTNQHRFFRLRIPGSP